MNIGDFGVVEREVEASAGDASTEPDAFLWYGEKIRIKNDVSSYTLMKFAALASGQIETSELAMMGLVVSVLRTWIEPEDWPTFEDLAEKHNAESELFGQVVAAVYHQLLGRPTRRSADSSSGLPTADTTQPSNGKSSATSRPSKRAASTKTRPKKAATATG